MDREIREWMASTIEAVQPYCDETLIAAHTFQGAGEWASAVSGGFLFGGLFRRAPKDVRKRAGGLPDMVVLAIGPTKIYVFPYETKGTRLVVPPPVRVWYRDDVLARGDKRLVASKLTIDVKSTGDHHELESTSMTGRLGKMTLEMFRLLEDPTIGAPAPTGFEVDRLEPPRASDPRRDRLGELADEIEGEMKRTRVWMPNPPAEEEVLAGGAFGLGTVAFDTWLQVVLVHRLRQAAAGELPIPSSSSISAQATREYDGDTIDRGPLMELLYEVDRLVASGA